MGTLETKPRALPAVRSVEGRGVGRKESGVDSPIVGRRHTRGNIFSKSRPSG